MPHYGGIAPAPPADKSLRLFLATISANLGGLLVGLQLSLFSGILEMATFASAIPVSTTSKSLIATSLILGAILASFPSGPICDKFGRRPSLFLVSLIFSLSVLLMFTSSSTLQLVMGRFIAGFGYALANIVCPMYSAEVSPPSLRGIIVNLYQLFIVTGIFLAQLINWRYWDSNWKIPLYIALIPSVAMTILVAFVTPESPSWLVNHSRQTEALTCAEKLGISTPGEDDLPDTPQQKPPPLHVLLRDSSVRRRLVIGAGLGVAQQLTGVNGVIFFGPALVSDVLHMSGSSAPFRAAAIVGFAFMAAGLISMIVIERFGRRTLLLAAGAPMIVSLIALWMIRDGLIARSPVLGVGMLIVYIMAFAITYGPLPFVVAAEVFPLAYKGVGMGISTAALMTCSAAVGGGFLWGIRVLGGGVYLVFAGFVLSSTLFVWAVVPETRNLSLREIDDMLG